METNTPLPDGPWVHIAAVVEGADHDAGSKTAWKCKERRVEPRRARCTIAGLQSTR